MSTPEEVAAAEAAENAAVDEITRRAFGPPPGRGFPVGDAPEPEPGEPEDDELTDRIARRQFGLT